MKVNLPDLVVVIVSYGAISYRAFSYSRKQDIEYAVPLAEKLQKELMDRWKARVDKRGHKPVVSVYQLATRFS